MVDHGRPWSTMIAHGRPWSTMIDHGRPWFDHGRPWYHGTMVPWCHGTMVPWSVSERNKRPKLTSKRRTDLKTCVPEAKLVKESDFDVKKI